MKNLLIIAFIVSTTSLIAQQYPQEGQEGWFKVEVGTKENLRRVQFTSRTHGWICGDSNAYHTTTGGDDWTPFSAPGNHHYFYFLNDSTGIAIGKSPDNKQLSIIRTSDRGLTWTEPFFYSSILQGADMTHIGDTVWFLNRSEGIRSIDGGKNWTMPFSTTTGFPRSISFADSKHGFVAGHLSAMAGNYASFAYTVDGGEHWFEKISYITVDLKEIFALSPNKLFVVGNYERIFKTADAGDSWDTLPHQPNINAYYDVTFSDPINGLIVGAPGLIKRTTDGGQTWSYQDSHVKYPEDTNTAIYLRSVSFTDSLYGWTVGDGGIALRTRTGGFTTQGVVRNSLINIPTRVYPEPNIGLARIKYYLPESQNVTLKLYSMGGQVTKNLIVGYQLVGENEIVLDLNDVAAGVYQFALLSAKFTSTGHLTVVK